MTACRNKPLPRQVIWTQEKNPRTLLLEIAENLAQTEAPSRRTMKTKVQEGLEWIRDLNLDPEEVVAKLVRNGFLGEPVPVVDGQKLRVVSAEIPETVVQEQVGPVLVAAKPDQVADLVVVDLDAAMAGHDTHGPSVTRQAFRKG